jgi:hypothetical protein
MESDAPEVCQDCANVSPRWRRSYKSPCRLEIPKSAATPQFKKTAKAGRSRYEYGLLLMQPGFRGAQAVHT